MVKISVITACYNSASTISRTVSSVLSQSYGNKEYVVIDGGSSDGTLEILRNASNGIHVLVSEPDKGIYDAFNKGVLRSSGDVIAFLNSDDFYLDEHVLERVAQAFERGNCDAVFGDIRFEDQRGRVVRVWKHRGAGGGRFRWGWMPPHPALFVRRDLFDAGLFLTDFGSGSDYEFMIRAIHKPRRVCYHIPCCLVVMATGGASDAGLMSRLRANRLDREAWRLNGLRPPILIRVLKPLRKLGQLFFRGTAQKA